MSFALNGNRLREARQYRQLTITKLAEKVNVSKQMISKYERENASPGLDVVQKIIKALDFPLEFFTSYDKLNFSNEGTFFRSRLTATQAEKSPSETFKKAVGITGDFFSRYVEFPELFNRETKSRSPRNAAIELRNLWELGDQPISNMIRLLESHGIIVSISNSNSSKVDANSGYIEVNDHRYYIILIDSNSRSFYRQQFSLAHELGHFILHAESFDPQTLEAPEYRQMENEADEFASEFLLPEESFKKSLDKEIMNLDWYINLKRKWFVSAASMIYRARNLEILTADQYLRLQKRISYHKWRKEEPLDSVTPANFPQLLKQALDLIEQADIFKANELSELLGKNYGIPYPNEMLSQIIGIPLTRFNGEVVQLKKYNIQN